MYVRIYRKIKGARWINKLADMMHRKLQERLGSKQSMNDLNLTFDINLLFIEEVTYKYA